MNAQQIPFKLYSRLIDNRSRILISLHDLHIAVDEGMPVSATLRHCLPKLGFILNQDYIEVENTKAGQPTLTFLVTLETALIYLNTFDETTDKIKNCIKAIVKLLSAKTHTVAQYTLEQELQKQHYITQSQAFFSEYFSFKGYHFLLPEDDLVELEKIDSACFALRMLLLDVKNPSLNFEELSDLFSSCISPLRSLLTRVKTLREEADKYTKEIQKLVNAF